MQAQPHHHQHRQQQESDDPEQARRQQGIRQSVDRCPAFGPAVLTKVLTAVDTVES